MNLSTEYQIVGYAEGIDEAAECLRQIALCDEPLHVYRLVEHKGKHKLTKEKWWDIVIFSTRSDLTEKQLNQWWERGDADGD